ncbi:MAG: endonuclease/exonuclease/phosphatase family protein [Firmicutes bacterium]|nr:endonuclease/exonuclease/phosphatase family protein [Bacillota bacterium]
MQLKLMSFNLRYWNQSDGEYGWPERRDSVAELIRRENPLVLGTQEGLPPMLADLDERLPAYDRIGEGRWPGGENEHNAIYYRRDAVDVLRSGQFWLSETPDVPASKSWDSSLPRICTWGIFELKPSREKIAFFNTHLDHEGSEAREKGTQLIWQEMSKFIQKGMPSFLTGDFNCKPDSSPIKFLRSQLTDALHSQGKGDIGTFHGFRGAASPGPIDYIFASRDVTVLSAEVLDCEVNDILPSDHFPIAARVSLETGKS